MDKVLSSTSYSEKQEAFRNFVKEIQASLGSKEYQKKGIPIEKFVKIKWNISKAQAYRYVVCAKVIDQLKEFAILPCHERLCRSLNNTTRTSSQMKLLWSTVIRRFKPENINSTNVIKVWKELYADERYYDICHYEDNIIKKVESTLSKLSNQMKNKHLKQNNQMSQTMKIPQIRSENIQSISYTYSSSLPDFTISNQTENTNTLTLPENKYYCNMNCNSNYFSIPPIENNNYLLLQDVNQYIIQFPPQQSLIYSPEIVYNC